MAATQIENYYIAELQARGCDAEMYVNAIPVARAYGASPHQTRPVNHYLQPGKNEFAIAALLGPTPTTAWRRPPEDMPATGKVKARLWRVPPGGFPGEAGSEALVTLEWPVTENDSRLKLAAFEMPSSTPTPAWTGCEQVQLTEVERAEIVAILKALSTSLQARNPEPFIRAAAPRYADCGAAFGIDLEADREEFRRQLASFPDAVFEEIDEKLLDLRVVARSRQIDCLDREWRSPLRTRPEKDGSTKLSYRIRLGKIGGTWRIVT